MAVDALVRTLAQKALDELDAAEPDGSPVDLLGGRIAWGEDPLARVEAARDPENAPAMRPHVIAPCQALRHHPALRLHCSCGRGLDFLALAAFATGVLVVSSPRLLPPRHRHGGTGDLASPDEKDPDRDWNLSTWEASLRRREATHGTRWKPDPHPVLGQVVVVGDTARRQSFQCTGCGAAHLFRNVTLLRLVLQAMAAGSRKVRLAGPESVQVERPPSAAIRPAQPALPLPAGARRHVCTIWCAGGEHVERVGPLEPRSDDEMRTAFEAHYGLEVTRIEPSPEYMRLPGDPAGRLIWFRPIAG